MSSDPLRSESSGYDSFVEFWEPVDLAALSRANRRALLDEWRRRGQVGLPWAAREFDKGEEP